MPKFTVDELFQRLDLNGDGVLDLAEVTSQHDKLGMTEAEAIAMFRELDADDSGTLTRDEATTLLNAIAMLKPPAGMDFIMLAAFASPIFVLAASLVLGTLLALAEGW